MWLRRLQVENLEVTRLYNVTLVKQQVSLLVLSCLQPSSCQMQFSFFFCFLRKWWCFIADWWAYRIGWGKEWRKEKRLCVEKESVTCAKTETDLIEECNTECMKKHQNTPKKPVRSDAGPKRKCIAKHWHCCVKKATPEPLSLPAEAHTSSHPSLYERKLWGRLMPKVLRPRKVCRKRLLY